MYSAIPKPKLLVSTAAFLAMALVAPVNRARAADGRCLNVSLNQTATVTTDSTSTGTIAQGGILTGTTTDTFTSGLMATPDPDTFSYTDTFTFMTRDGILTTSDVSLFDTTHLVYTTIQRVSSGTGIFRGTTGTIFSFGSSTDGIHFTDKFIGQLCLAKGQ